jgi:hypothetical protein
MNYGIALRITTVICAICLLVLLTFVPLSSNDFWLQARIGRWIVETKEIPHTVLFTFTDARDRTFNAHEWLASVFFYGALHRLGEDRLVLVLGFFGVALFLLSVGLAWRVGRDLAPALALSMCAMLVANYRHLLRPELFSLLLLVCVLHVLTSFQHHGRRLTLLWCLPIALIWANSHASFILGPIATAIFAVGDATDAWRLHRDEHLLRRRRLSLDAALPFAATGLAMLAVSIVNPLGIDLLRFAFNLSTSEVTKTYIKEWLPTFSYPFIAQPAFLLFAIFAVGVLILFFLYRHSLRTADALLVLAFALLAFQRSRFIVFFGFAALPACARIVGSTSQRAGRVWLMATTAGCAMGIAIVMTSGNAYGAFPYFAASNQFSEPMRGQIEADALQGHVLNSYELGAELIYRAWPRLQPSIDSRIDSYGGDYFLSHQDLLVNEDALRAFVDRYTVRYMLLLWRDFQHVRLMNHLQADGWHMRFADHKMVLLERDDRRLGDRLAP